MAIKDEMESLGEGHKGPNRMAGVMVWIFSFIEANLLLRRSADSRSG